MNYKNLFDRYEWQARLFPAFVVIFPAILSILIWIPDTRTSYKGILSLLGTFGVMHLISRISRNLGKSKENELFEHWGGKPTTLVLRHRNNEFDGTTKKRYFKFLENNIEGLKMPSLKEEDENTDAADETYESAIRWLREKSRDKNKYYLVFQENIHFGFCRNLWAFKKYAIIINIANLIANFLGIYIKYKFNLNNIKFEIIISIMVGIIFLYIWTFIINKEWVRLTAYAYARALLSVCEDIS